MRKTPKAIHTTKAIEERNRINRTKQNILNIYKYREIYSVMLCFIAIVYKFLVFIGENLG